MLTRSLLLASIAFFVLLHQIVLGCIHDQLAHKLTSGDQQYSDNHPLNRFNRRRRLEEATSDDTTNYQTYDRDIGEQVAAGGYQPIRIVPYYDNSTLSTLTVAQRKLIQTIIPDAIARFKAALQVVPVQGNLAAKRSCSRQWRTTPLVCNTFVSNEMCLEMPMPAAHFGATRYCNTCTSTGCANDTCAYTNDGGGIPNADFLLYVRTVTTEYCNGGSTLAYASSCQKDQYDRPTFGMVNFCPAAISSDPREYDHQLYTALHEITHALGFSAQFIPYFRLEDGTPRTARDANGQPQIQTSGTCPNGQAIRYYVKPSDDTVQFTKERGHSVAKLVTPRVKAFVQEHFNCSSVIGAELESQDDGCFGSHWEERLFEPEYMSPVSSYRNVFSALTLAFLEDSGWYKTTASVAERLHFGEQRGCSFATDKCINPQTEKSIADDHYCTSTAAESCSVDATSRSVCTLSTGVSNSIPSYFQYFKEDPTKGGLDDFADYCPMNIGYTYGDCRYEDNLSMPRNTNINILGETYCPTCKCTQTTLRSSDSTRWIVNSRRQTGCYAMRCLNNSTVVEITIPRSATNDAVTVNCSVKGEQKTIPGFTGVLTCPDPFIICDNIESTTSYYYATTSAGITTVTGKNSSSGSGSNTSTNLRVSSGAVVERATVMTTVLWFVMIHLTWLHL